MTEDHISQTEAARLVGCSRDTIVRARRSGRLPHARLHDHQWSIPIADLIAAGLYHPPDENSDPVSPPASPDEAQSAATGEPTAVELVRARTQVAALEDVVARQDEELRFLRLTIATLTRRGAA